MRYISVFFIPIVVLIPGIAAIGAPATVPQSSSATVYSNLAYVPDGDPAQVLDVYVPVPKPEKPLPLIVHIHGGGWSGGSKKGNPAARFVNNGYINASIEYRFSQKAIFPAQIQDCQASIRWLRDHANDYSIDPDKIGVWGESAGGHLVALLGTTGGKHIFPMIGGNYDQSDRVQAVVDDYGPTDFTTVVEQAANDSHVKNIFDFTRGNDPYSKLIGGVLDSSDPAAIAVSPMHYVDSGCPPFFILHGTYDKLVPYQQSVDFVKKLEENHVPVAFQTIPGAGHGGKEFDTSPLRQLTLAFFDYTLKGRRRMIEPLSESQVAVSPPAPATAHAK